VDDAATFIAEQVGESTITGEDVKSAVLQSENAQLLQGRPRTAANVANSVGKFKAGLFSV